jgi:hypothetical protein
MKRIAPVLVALLVFGPDAAGAAGIHTARAPRHKPAPKTKPAPAPASEPEPAPAPEPAAAPAPSPAPASALAAPPEPAPAPPPPPEKASKTAGPSVESLRAEYDEIRDALFRSRARRETLETALFSTQLLPTIVWEGGRHHSVKHAEVRFDGVRLWESNEGGLTSGKEVALAPKSAPPGPHVIGVRVEVRSRDDTKLGYVSDQSFALTLPEGKKTKVEITVDEDGSAPSYNPDIEIEVSSK